MFPFGSRVQTRNGKIGIIVRQLINHAPYQYLVASMDDKQHILFDTDLSLVAGAEGWRITDEPGKGFERRTGERRRAEQNRAVKSRSDRRVAERRQAERRWIGENPGGRRPAE